MKYLLIIAIAAGLNILPDMSVAQTSQYSGREYSVQILLADEHLELGNKKFKGVTDITEEICEGPYKYKYTTGNTRTFHEAAELRLKMVEVGFTDAFVVLYGNGKRLLPKYDTETSCIRQGVVAEPPVASTVPDKTTTPKQKKPPHVMTESESRDYNTITKDESTTSGNENTASKTESDSKPAAAQDYTVVHAAPQFPYGEDSLHSYIKYNLLYPYPPIDKNDPATVMVAFTVNTNGKIINPKVTNGLNSRLNAEAIRVVKQMPAWTPGTSDGTYVNKECVLKIDFHLPDLAVRNVPMNSPYLDPIGKK